MKTAIKYTNVEEYLMSKFVRNRIMLVYKKYILATGNPIPAERAITRLQKKMLTPNMQQLYNYSNSDRS